MHCNTKQVINKTRANFKGGTNTWTTWREVGTQEPVELTLEDISAGKGVGVPAHLIRIKK